MSYPPYNQQQGYPQQGYPPQNFNQGFNQQQQFRPQQGFPQQTGFPQQQGFPQQTGFPQQGFPQQTGGFQQTTVTKITTTSGGPPPTLAPPPSSFNGHWYASYYNQMNRQELQEIQAWFSSVDRDRSGSITANELAGITFNGVPLGYDVALKLVRVFDKDRSGTIDFYEYAAMHKFLSALQTAFFAADSDRSGRIDAREIHTALQTCGFSVSLPAVQALMGKYDKTGYGLTFQEFLLVCATIAQGRSLFEWRDTQRTGKLTLTLDQLLELVGQMG